MSRTRNANSILVGNTSEETVGARKAAQVLAATIFAALFAVPVASALIRPPEQQAAPLSRLASTAQLPSNVHTPGVQSEPGAPPAPRAAHRIYLLGSFARTSTLSPAKVKAKTSTLLKPTAVKIAANQTGGSMNKVQQVFSIH
jgi:hypothetical protein